MKRLYKTYICMVFWTTFESCMNYKRVFLFICNDICITLNTLSNSHKVWALLCACWIGKNICPEFTNLYYYNSIASICEENKTICWNTLFWTWEIGQGSTIVIGLEAFYLIWTKFIWYMNMTRSSNIININFINHYNIDIRSCGFFISSPNKCCIQYS